MRRTAIVALSILVIPLALFLKKEDTNGVSASHKVMTGDVDGEISITARQLKELKESHHWKQLSADEREMVSSYIDPIERVFEAADIDDQEFDQDPKSDSINESNEQAHHDAAVDLVTEVNGHYLTTELTREELDLLSDEEEFEF